MAEKTFIIAAPVDQARSLVGSVFTQGGWTVELSPTGGLVLTRGKKGLTIAFGAFMGSSFYLVQSVEFGTGPPGDRRHLPLLLHVRPDRRRPGRTQVQ